MAERSASTKRTLQTSRVKRYRIYGPRCVTGSLLVLMLVLCVCQGFMFSVVRHRSDCRFASTVIGKSIADADDVQTKAGPSDWILTSYMRSGSSFTGQLLGHRLDTFYWFEPLFAFHVHFWSEDKVCYDPFDRHHCRPPKRGEKTTQQALTVVKKVLNCNISDLVNLVERFNNAKKSGVHWKDFEDCHRSNASTKQCLLDVEAKCRNARHRGIKLLRLTVDNVGQMMKANPNLKVVHLFRDPRAIINSRQTTDWYSFSGGFNGSGSLPKVEDATFLCKRMLHEARAGEVLRLKYPDRFGFVLYEDLLSDVQSRSRFIFDFLGVNTTTDSKTNITVAEIDKNMHTIKKPSNDFKNWWKLHIDYKTVRKIDEVCKDIYDILGYLPIKGEDMNSTTHKFKKEFLLENISRKTPYNL